MTYQRRLKQARTLRTSGATLAVAGPPAVVFGAGLIIAIFPSSGENTGLLVSGGALLMAGSAATLVGYPILLGGGSVASSLLEGPRPRAGGRWRWAGAGLLLGAVIAPIVDASVDSGLGIPAGLVLYAGAIGCTWHGTNVTLRTADDQRRMVVHPTLTHDQVGVRFASTF